MIDVLSAGGRDPESVIQIEFQRSDPPEGWARRLQGEDGHVRFSGWLGLLQAVWQLATDESSGEMAGGLGGEFGPGRDVELAEHAAQMGRHRAPRDVEAVADLAVGETLGDETDDPLLRPGEG